MKLITAILRPFKVEEVREALLAIGVNGLTVTEVQGYGRQKGHTEIYRGAEYEVQMLPKAKLEIVIKPELVQPAIDVIVAVGRTGKVGDGKIFVSDIERAVRIRTGEIDIDAL
jgi:nitrogen regulatory protein P-II 1